MEKLYFVISSFNIGDEGRKRLRNCLISIQNQTVPACVIVSDGSSPEQKAKTKTLTAEYGATFLHQPMKGLNIPKLNNRGIELAIQEGGTVIGTTGIDFLFAPKFAKDAIFLTRPGRLLQTECRNLKRGIKTHNWHWPDKWHWPESWHLEHPAGYGANGGCQMADPLTWEQLGGFDEAMAGHGGMDNDLQIRAKALGIDIGWMLNFPSNMHHPRMLHQWHPITKWQSPSQIYQRDKNWELMGQKDRGKLDYLST